MKLARSLDRFGSSINLSILVTLTTSKPVPNIAFLNSSLLKFDLSSNAETATPSGHETFTCAFGLTLIKALVTIF